MPMTVTSLKSFFIRYRAQAECIAVALLAVVVFTSLGLGARRKLALAQAEVAAASTINQEISGFRAAFKPSPAANQLAAPLPDSLAVWVPRDDRVSLVGNLASRAELVGLSGVRVSFAAPDSATVPGQPELFATAVAVADYGVSIECAGSFAQVLSFVNQLPPSVALQRISAVHDKAGSHFHVMLAVFEAPRAAQDG